MKKIWKKLSKLDISTAKTREEPKSPHNRDFIRHRGDEPPAGRLDQGPAKRTETTNQLFEASNIDELAHPDFVKYMHAEGAYERLKLVNGILETCDQVKQLLDNLQAPQKIDPSERLSPYQLKALIEEISSFNPDQELVNFYREQAELMQGVELPDKDETMLASLKNRLNNDTTWGTLKNTILDNIKSIEAIEAYDLLRDLNTILITHNRIKDNLGRS